MENTNNKFWLIYFMDLNLNLCFVYHSSGTLKTSVVHTHSPYGASMHARWNALIICSSYYFICKKNRAGKRIFFTGCKNLFPSQNILLSS